MKNRTASKRNILRALYWGAAWGLLEATVGHTLHLLRVRGLAGFVMGSIGLFLMSRAFRDSGKPGAVFLTSVTAACLKSIDFLMPGIDPSAVFHPVLAILCQGLALAAFFSLAGMKRPFFIRPFGTDVRIDSDAGSHRMAVEKTKTTSRDNMR